MASTGILSGFEARGQINDVAFAFSEFTIRRMAESLDTTNSEGEYFDDGTHTPETDAGFPGSFQGSVDGPRVAEISIKQATLDFEALPWDSPFSIIEGDRIRLEIYPTGDSADGTHTFPCVLVSESVEETATRGLQAFTFNGKSVGKYTLA